MNVQSFTLGDGTIILVTYDASGKILTVSSNNPIYYLAFGPDSQVFNIGEFENETFASLSAVMAWLGL